MGRGLPNWADRGAGGAGVAMATSGGDPTASVTDDHTGAVLPGGSWTWQVTVRNGGSASPTYQNGGEVILQDDLPAGLQYGTPVVSAITAYESVSCSIASLTVTCSSNGGP